jgi:ABC-2 type transport system ATP-binding protein
MIEVSGLTKDFRGNGHVVRAVEDLTLEVHEGEVFGFLGPNGAGKSTTVRMLASLIAPTRGTATINGLRLGVNDAQIRAQIGILTEAPGLYERLSARANLEIFARLYHVAEVDGQVAKYLRLMDLWHKRDAEAGTLSKGMKQRLAIARALLHEPAVLFLDEPTGGLDPEGAKTVRECVSSLRCEGRTIFLCTHNLDEAERLCDRIGVLRQRLIAVDTPEALRRKLFGRQTAIDAAKLTPAGLERLRALPFVRHVEVRPNGDHGSHLTVNLRDPVAENPAVVRVLVDQGAEVRYVTEVRHSLEDVYLNLMHEPAGTVQ